MNKEEILEKSRRENKNQDVSELEAIKKASAVSVRVGMITCCVIAVLEVILTEKISLGSFAIYFSILATLFLVKYILLRKKHELVLTVLYYILFAAFFILDIIRMCGIM